MSLSFVKVYFDFEERTEMLNETEQGRLLLAMLRYAQSKTLPELKGNERFLFPVFKADIDRDAATYSAKVSNGAKGGRPRQEPNKTEDNQEEPNKTEDNLIDKNKNKNKNKTKNHALKGGLLLLGRQGGRELLRRANAQNHVEKVRKQRKYRKHSKKSPCDVIVYPMHSY